MINSINNIVPSNQVGYTGQFSDSNNSFDEYLSEPKELEKDNRASSRQTENLNDERVLTHILANNERLTQVLSSSAQNVLNSAVGLLNYVDNGVTIEQLSNHFSWFALNQTHSVSITPILIEPPNITNTYKVETENRFIQSGFNSVNNSQLISSISTSFNTLLVVDAKQQINNVNVIKKSMPLDKMAPTSQFFTLKDRRISITESDDGSKVWLRDFKSTPIQLKRMVNEVLTGFTGGKLNDVKIYINGHEMETNYGY